MASLLQHMVPSWFPRPWGDFYDPLYGGLCCSILLLTTYCSNPVTELNSKVLSLLPCSRGRRACHDCSVFYLNSLLSFSFMNQEMVLVWECWVRSVTNLRQKTQLALLLPSLVHGSSGNCWRAASVELVHPWYSLEMFVCFEVIWMSSPSALLWCDPT